MTERKWKDKIERACCEAGTYKPFFDTVISQLAGILEVKDTALEQFHQSHDKPVIIHTNKAGHTNMVKNPALVVINECNQQALAYWRDLGLTPSGYKRLNGDSQLSEKDTTFENMLSKIGI